MCCPVSQSVGDELECPLRRVHKITPLEAKKQCGFNQGETFTVEGCMVPGFPCRECKLLQQASKPLYCALFVCFRGRAPCLKESKDHHLSLTLKKL